MKNIETVDVPFHETDKILWARWISYEKWKQSYFSLAFRTYTSSSTGSRILHYFSRPYDSSFNTRKCLMSPIFNEKIFTSVYYLNLEKSDFSWDHHIVFILDPSMNLNFLTSITDNFRLRHFPRPSGKCWFNWIWNLNLLVECKWTQTTQNEHFRRKNIISIWFFHL